jgi:hypothetical protein
MITSFLNRGCAGLVLAAAVALSAGTAMAQTRDTVPASMPPVATLDMDFAYPVEGASPAQAAKAAMQRCTAGAVSQTWHMACTFQAIWGNGFDHRNHPSAHSSVFISAAMAEAVAQTARYKTRENEVYRKVVGQFSGTRAEVSYTAFLEATERAFRRTPRTDAAFVTAEARP